MRDNLVESFYPNMMRCYLTLDEPAQAPLAYRRCCDILAVVFGLKPARETEAIRQKISG